MFFIYFTAMVKFIVKATDFYCSKAKNSGRETESGEDEGADSGIINKAPRINTGEEKEIETLKEPRWNTET